MPKAPISSSVSQEQKRPIGLFSFLATIIFLLSLGLAGAAYGYRIYLNNEQVQMKSDLEKNVKAFELNTIQEYVRLDSRMSIAKLLLSKHISASNILNYLSTVTLKTIRFNDFKYSLNADGTIKVSMSGQAKTYNSVAFQSQVFGETKALKGPIFSNLDLDDKGNVVFDFTTTIDPSFISYSNTLDQRAGTQGVSNSTDQNASTTFMGGGVVDQTTASSSVNNAQAGVIVPDGSNLIPSKKK